MAKENQGESLTSKAVVVTDKAAASVVVNGATFKVVSRVNLPTLKQDDGETVCFRIDAPIRQETNYVEEEVIVNGEKVMATRENLINVVRVTELYSNEPHEYVCNAMTADNLRSAYPENGYVGKTFAVIKRGLVPGKRYKQTDVVEIEAA